MTRNLGQAASYDLRYAASPITTEAEFSAATHFTIPAPQPSGATELAVVTGLDLSSEVYFALKVIDGAGNALPLEQPQGGRRSVLGRDVHGAAQQLLGQRPHGHLLHLGLRELGRDGRLPGHSGTGDDVPVLRDVQRRLLRAGDGRSQTGRVIFSELNILGAEVIELRNTTGAAFDVHGYTLRNAAGPRWTSAPSPTRTARPALPSWCPPTACSTASPTPPEPSPWAPASSTARQARLSPSRTPGMRWRSTPRPAGNLQDCGGLPHLRHQPGHAADGQHFVGFAGSSTQLDTGGHGGGQRHGHQLGVSFYGHPEGLACTQHPGRAQRQLQGGGHQRGPHRSRRAEMTARSSWRSPARGLHHRRCEDHRRRGQPPRRGSQRGRNSNAGDTDGEYTIPAGTRIPVDGILLIADSRNAAGTVTSVPDFVLAWICWPGTTWTSRTAVETRIQLVSASGQLLDALGQEPDGAQPGRQRGHDNGLAMYEGSVAATRQPLGPLDRLPTLARSSVSTDSNNNLSDFHVNPSSTTRRAQRRGEPLRGEPHAE